MSKKRSQGYPVVFISYSQDSQKHKDKVLAFANKLREDGIDALLDQYEESPQEGWPKWMDRHIENSDFVLLVCTETYFRRVMGTEEKGKGLGVRWEATLVYQDVYDTGSEVKRFVPVLFKDGKPEHVPKPLKGFTYYRVDTEEGYDELYRRLTDQPKTKKPVLGKRKSRSPRKPKADFLQSSGTEMRKSIGASEQIEVIPTSEAAMPTNLFKNLPPSFRNPFELNSEYILIPGGRYRYEGKTEEVSNVYFAKYPVTNKRYRRFIRYLEEKEQELLEILRKGEFDRRMTEFASGIEDFGPYLGDRPDSWPEKLRSDFDQEKRFKRENQPVVGVSWFDASAYCYWLSLLEAASRNLPLNKAASVYRLPNEVEWVWAASGGKRRYPWGNKQPNDKLANYAENVGATTRVGCYPGGATPEGLMDMAGNAYEWMENWFDEDEDTRSNCGGSWHGDEDYLSCSLHLFGDPDQRFHALGFRVVRSQP